MCKKKPSILLICNTPFQIMMAYHITLLYYVGYEIDMVISEGIRDGEQLAKNAQKTNAFRNVIFTRNKKTFLLGHSPRDKIKYLLGRGYEVINNYKIAKNLAKNSYDVCLFSNISILTKLLTSLLRKQNPHVKLALFEEGLVTYTTLFASGDAPNSLYRKYIDKQGLLAKLNFVYVCHPSLLEWEPQNGAIIHLPIIDKTNLQYVELLNTIFNYNGYTDKYDRRIIFFEESYAFEGFLVPDIEIVTRIAETLGHDNIMVKIHPRNPENRFAKLGYKTNKNISIPWEMIMLNQPLKENIFVTISSGAVISPYLYLGLPCVTYSLLNCLETFPGHMNGALGKIMQKIYNQYSDIFKAPQTIDQFIAQLCES